MRKKHSFREPLGKDTNGLYITAAQMQFFLNRKGAGKKFLSGHPEFFDYFYKCAIYNIIWDLAEENPESAVFFWDEEEGSLGVKFPPDGTIMKELKKKKIHCYFDEEEE